MKKVLIVSYYWPPMGGGGVQRWLKMTKYIKNFGWEPIIFTSSGADISLHDESLFDDVAKDIEVIKCNIWEPFRLYKRLTGNNAEKINPGFLKQKKGNSFLDSFSVWIRGNFFIPDAKRFWHRPSVNSLSSYISKNHVDAIVSTGPPHTTHLIAYNISNKFRLPWLADFRDPWTNIDFYDQLKLTKWADRKHKKLEKKILLSADRVVTVSESWAQDFKRISGVDVSVVTNGFDPADFHEVDNLSLDRSFTITHVGSLNKDRNPYIFWSVIKNLIKENKFFAQDIHIKLIGPIDITVKDELEKNHLTNVTTLIDVLPHKEAVIHLITSQVLLLPLNDVPNINGVIPGKMYEYFGAKRPILCIGKKTFSANSSEYISLYLAYSFASCKKSAKLPPRLTSARASAKESLT